MATQPPTPPAPPDIQKWIQQYFPTYAWSTALAIVYRETGGTWNAKAVNNTSRPDLPGFKSPAPGNYPEYSIGLFQVNTEAWPDIAKQFDLSDPLQNIQAAYQIWLTNGFSPWGTSVAAPTKTTDTTSTDTTAPEQPTGPSGTQPGSSTGNNPVDALMSVLSQLASGIAAIGAFLKNIGDLITYTETNISRFLIRFFLVMFGTVLALLGSYYLMRSFGA